MRYTVDTITERNQTVWIVRDPAGYIVNEARHKTQKQAEQQAATLNALMPWVGGKR